MQNLDSVIQTQTCLHCQSSFEITQWDIDFYTKISPKFGEQRFQIPTPTLCPDCRQRRRMAFRNERTLYRRICDASKQPIISLPMAGALGVCAVGVVFFGIFPSLLHESATAVMFGFHWAWKGIVGFLVAGRPATSMFLIGISLSVFPNLITPNPQSPLTRPRDWPVL